MHSCIHLHFHHWEVDCAVAFSGDKEIQVEEGTGQSSVVGICGDSPWVASKLEWIEHKVQG